MKFNKYLPLETREFLEKQYKEYIKETPMTQKEQRVLREWVKDGHSVYENASLACAEGGVPVEFLTVWRDEEYIRQYTKGMSPEETRKFAMNCFLQPLNTKKCRMLSQKLQREIPHFCMCLQHGFYAGEMSLQTYLCF